jgi:hypothetical protein
MAGHGLRLLSAGRQLVLSARPGGQSKGSGRTGLGCAIVLLLLAGCGLSREARIERRLEHAGLKPELARCVAHRLDRRLSNDQLGELADAAKRAKGPDGKVRLDALAATLQASDPAVAAVVGRAALHCTLLG